MSANFFRIDNGGQHRPLIRPAFFCAANEHNQGNRKKEYKTELNLLFFSVRSFLSAILQQFLARHKFLHILKIHVKRCKAQ